MTTTETRCLQLHSTLRMEAAWPSETFITRHIITWRHNPEEHDLIVTTVELT